MSVEGHVAVTLERVTPDAVWSFVQYGVYPDASVISYRSIVALAVAANELLVPAASLA